MLCAVLGLMCAFRTISQKTQCYWQLKILNKLYIIFFVIKERCFLILFLATTKTHQDGKEDGLMTHQKRKRKGIDQFSFIGFTSIL